MNMTSEWKILEDIKAELDRAAKWPAFNSAHEGYAILAEEFDELKAHVWRKRRTSGGTRRTVKNRNLEDMRAEAIQVAAMAVKVVQMIDAGRGRV